MIRRQLEQNSPRVQGSSPIYDRQPEVDGRDVLTQMQRSLGNRTLAGMIERLGVSGASPCVPVQAKLTVGDPGDECERQADRMAAAVTEEPASGEPFFDRHALDPTTTQFSGPRPGHGAPGFEAAEDFERRLRTTAGQGAVLPTAMRRQFEAMFRADFSAVRIHTGTRSQQLNDAIQAQAFTHRHDIYLRSNYAGLQGRRLLAHELTHVVQQAGAQPESFSSQTGHSVIQRLPNKSQLVNVYGKEGWRLKKQAVQKYEAVLEALRKYEEFISRTKANTKSLTDLKKRYIEIATAAREFREASSGQSEALSEYMLNLREQVGDEVLVASKVVHQVGIEGGLWTKGRLWKEVLPGPTQTTQTSAPTATTTSTTTTLTPSASPTTTTTTLTPSASPIPAHTAPQPTPSRYPYTFIPGIDTEITLKNPLHTYLGQIDRGETITVRAFSQEMFHVFRRGDPQPIFVKRADLEYAMGQRLG